MNAVRFLSLALLGSVSLSRAQTPTPTPEMTFFVTSIGSLSRPNDPYVGANFGGLAGADAFCRELAIAAGKPEKIWRAYLSTAHENSPPLNARDRIGTGPWYNAQGQLIANNVAELHANGIPAALMMDENGNPVPSNEHDILTGASQDGGVDYNGTGENFTTSGPEFSVAVGHSDGGGVGQYVAQSWNAAHLAGCDEAGLAAVGGAGRLYAFAIGDLPTEIAVEQPAGMDIPTGGSRELVMATGTTTLTFTIRNTGGLNLTGLGVTIDGTDAAAFSVISSPSPPVKGGGATTTFTVQFASDSPGVKTAVLHIASNDADENPFNINLVGRRLSFSEDTDADGLNDAAEFQMAVQGFDWQASQPALVNNLFTYANGAGLYTPSQVQALNMDVPLITRDANGMFKLTIGIQKSTDLMSFNPFPMSAPQSVINAQGELEFQFTVPDDAAFFRLEAH